MVVTLRQAGTIAAGAVVIFLGTAGILKLYDVHGFLYSLNRLRITPGWLNAHLALYLPWVEVVVAVAFFARPWRVAALSIGCSLFVAFVLYSSIALFRGIDGNCACFGPFSSDVSVFKLVLNGLSLGVLMSALWVDFRTQRFSYRTESVEGAALRKTDELPVPERESEAVVGARGVGG